MISYQDYPDDGSRLDASTLPPFLNETRCASCRRLEGVRVHYCPGCRKIVGQHYHRLCPCGATWDEQ